MTALVAAIVCIDRSQPLRLSWLRNRREQWRSIVSTIFARSGGPPAAASMTSAAPRKYCGPIAAGVTMQTFGGL
jgi:hypothetical protein